jgi:polar amino acid transport system substrate-binding protein
MDNISAAVVSDLAPTGKLRVGINYGNPVLAKRDPSTRDLTGVAVDLARELGKRVNVPVELVPFESAGKMFDAAKDRAWDVAFLAIDAARADQIDFTAPYIEIEGTYLVPAGSPFHVITDVDRAGVRIGISSGSAYDLFLTRSIKHAELIRAPDPNGAFQLILESKVDVVAGVKQHLMANLKKLPGSRVLDDRFMAIQQALGIVKGRPLGAKYLREFIEDVKASGLVAQAIEKAGIGGVSVPSTVAAGR